MSLPFAHLLDLLSFAVKQISTAIPLFKRLEHLDLSNCRNITIKVFEKISKAKPPNLAALIVARLAERNSATLTNSALEIRDPYIAISSLTELNLSGIQSVSKQCLQRVADNSPGLTSILPNRPI